MTSRVTEPRNEAELQARLARSRSCTRARRPCGRPAARAVRREGRARSERRSRVARRKRQRRVPTTPRRQPCSRRPSRAHRASRDPVRAACLCRETALRRTHAGRASKASASAQKSSGTSGRPSSSRSDAPRSSESAVLTVLGARSPRRAISRTPGGRSGSRSRQAAVVMPARPGSDLEHRVRDLTVCSARCPWCAVPVPALADRARPVGRANPSRGRAGSPWSLRAPRRRRPRRSRALRSRAASTRVGRPRSGERVRDRPRFGAVGNAFDLDRERAYRPESTR